MEKIAILIRGPIRPDVKSCLLNIKKLIEQINGYEIETFFLTWLDEKVSDFMKNDKDKLIDNYIILKEPELEYIKTQLKTRCKVPGPLFDRNYKMFWSQKLGLDFIMSNGKNYDYMITTRPDLEIDLIDIEKWLSNDSYIMPKPFNSNNDININDRFGIGTSKIMYDAWNYKNNETLNNLYGESIGPEDCFYKIIKMNGVKIGNISTKHILDPKRNFEDKNYPYKSRQKLHYYIINPLTKVLGKNIEIRVYNLLRKLFPYK